MESKKIKALTKKPRLLILHHRGFFKNKRGHEKAIVSLAAFI